MEKPADYINHSLYFEAKTFLHGLFVVEDKLSMSHSLETRVPFMDNDLVDFAMNCPVGLKLQNLTQIKKINENDDIDGFIVQLPLPKHINQEVILNKVSPAKDVDGFHPNNYGKMTLGIDTFIPATPAGIIELIERSEIQTEGKKCLVIGRSQIVGRPISILLSQNKSFGNSTVTVAHSRSKDLEKLCLDSDIIISAIGMPEFIKGNMIKKGSSIIDVGITRVDDLSSPKGYRIVGDVDFKSVSNTVGYITPVPGGVGPMTIAMLLKNTLKACEFSD